MRGKKAEAYTKRWITLWHRVVRAAHTPPRRLEDAHLWLIEDYVEARRAAEDHQRAAELDPYPAGSSSRPFPHPGFERAAAARREAREVLADLLLTPRAFEQNGQPSPEPEEPLAPDGDQAGL